MCLCLFVGTSQLSKVCCSLSPRSCCLMLSSLKTARCTLILYASQSCPKLCNTRRKWLVWVWFCSNCLKAEFWRWKFFCFWKRTWDQVDTQHLSTFWRVVVRRLRWPGRFPFWVRRQCWACCRCTNGSRLCCGCRTCKAIWWFWFFCWDWLLSLWQTTQCLWECQRWGYFH